MAPRILLLTEATSCDAFFAAAQKLEINLLLGGSIRGAALPLRFDSRDPVLDIVTRAERDPFSAIIAVDEPTTSVACRSASMLGLLTHPPKAADFCAEWRKSLDALQIVTADQADTDSVFTCLVQSGRSRVVAVTDPSRKTVPRPRLVFESAPTIAPAVLDLLKRVHTAAALKHGPAHIRMRPGPSPAVTGLSIAAIAPHTDALNFFIPLVDENISWEEAVIRNALGLDLARLHRR